MATTIQRFALVVATVFVTPATLAVILPAVANAAECGAGTVYDEPSNTCVAAEAQSPPPPPPPAAPRRPRLERRHHALLLRGRLRPDSVRLDLRRHLSRSVGVRVVLDRHRDGMLVEPRRVLPRHLSDDRLWQPADLLVDCALGVRPRRVAVGVVGLEKDVVRADPFSWMNDDWSSTAQNQKFRLNTSAGVRLSPSAFHVPS